MNRGWIKLYRKLSDNKLWTSEPFTRGQAWVDMLLIANHKDSFIYVRGNRVDVIRGQVGWSITKLAERWRWSRGKVIRFLDALEVDQQIVQQKNHLSSLFTIINYDGYQENGPQTEQQTGRRRAADGPQTGTNKNEKNEKNEKKKKQTVFKKPSLEEVGAYCKERNNTVDPKAWIDHYISNGWKVGRNSMKDWKASVRTWERSSNNNHGQTKTERNAQAIEEGLSDE